MLDSHYKNELCACCGTDLEWWVNEKGKRVYRNEADECFCSKKCAREHLLSEMRHLKNITGLFKNKA